ncbi:MAG: hypothetical protein IJ532_04265 [Alphaproteobacteria bacterium]|nr:hypothetical protein [Alphaproteobacteria bacterium]
MNMKEKIVLTSLAILTSIPGFSQSRFKQYQEAKQKEFAAYKAQKQQEFDQYKNERTAQFRDYQNNNGQQKKVKTREELNEEYASAMENGGNRQQAKRLDPIAPQNVDGEHVYLGGIAAHDYGLGFDDISFNKKFDLEEGDRAYVYTSSKGVAVVYSNSNGFGANLKNNSVEYFQLKNGKKTSLSTVKDASTIKLLNNLNEYYGKVKFPQAKTQDKITKSKQNIQQAKQHKTAEGLSYTIGEDGVKFSGVMSINTNYLMPQIYYNQQNGMYTCGSHESFEESGLRRDVMLDLQYLVVENYIYKDLQKRAQQGERLTEAEKEFQEAHIKNLAKEGISITKDGKLKQQDPLIRQQTQNMQNNVGNGGIGG